MRIAKFQCEECGSEVRADMVDVFPNGTIKPEGRYVQRGGVWFDGEGNRIPETVEMFRIEGRLSDDAFCPHCVAELHRRPTAPAVLSDKTKSAEKIAGSLMAQTGLTDMRDNTREGEISAPKLSPHLQKAADSMFARRPVEPGAALAAVKGMPDDQSGRRGMKMLQAALKQGKKP